MLIQEIKKRLESSLSIKERLEKSTNNGRRMGKAALFLNEQSIGIYQSLIEFHKNQQEVRVEEVLAERCWQYMNKRLIVWDHVHKGKVPNPFPIGKTNLEKLIYKKELSLAQQVKLAEFFGMTLKITIE
jgi:hypothetical protein